MEPSKMEILLRAVNLGSINKAAKEMGYSQSGLTYMMDALEAEIGFLILKRDFNGVSFTEKGKLLEPFIHDLVKKEIALSAKVAEIMKESAGTVRIGTYPSIANYWLPEVIKDFRDNNPGTNIEIRVGGMEIQEWLENDEIDLGFVADDLIGEFEWIFIQNDQLYAVVPASLPLTEMVIPVKKLVDYPLLIPSLNEKSATSLMLKNLDSKQKLMVAGWDFTFFSMVGKGLGVTILSKLYMRDCPDTVRMLPTDPILSRELGIIVKRYKSLDPLIKKFISSLKAHELS